MNRQTTILAALVVSLSTLHCGAATFSNGNFETGNLNGWTTFITSNGDLGGSVGLPDVVMFDLDGDGIATRAARFMVGERVYISAQGHTDQGGGIFQNFDVTAGEYVIGANLGAQNSNALPNYTAGVFKLYVDGLPIITRDFRQLNGGADILPGQIQRSSFLTTIFLGQGTHEIRFQITRDWLNGGLQLGSTPFEYLDDIQITPVPEPSVTLLGTLAASVLLFYSRSKRTH